MKNVVIFDLDGTLVKGQSQRLFLNFMLQKRLIRKFPYLRILCWFVLHKAGCAQNPQRIMEYAFRFMKDLKLETLEKLVDEFFREELIHRIFVEGKALVRRHDDGKSELLLVSNAFEPLVKRAGAHLGIKTCIGSSLDTKNGRITGKIEGKPVMGWNKTARIMEHTALHQLNLAKSYAYCDHISDLPVLEMVANPVAVNPCRDLYKEAQIRNWQILHFKE